MTGWAADFSAAQINAVQLKAAGYSGAIRYITGDGKQITPAEFADLTTTPGIALALVNETFGQAASRGYAQGRSEAVAAFTRADQMGWPKDRPIHFVLEDPNWLPQPWPVLEEYLRGVLTVVPVSRVGDYGSAHQIAHMLAIGLCTYGWAVETWPGDESGCCLQQRYNPYPGAPHNFNGGVDPNMVLKADWGQWSATTPITSPPVIAPPIGLVSTLSEERNMIQTDQLVAGQLDTFLVDIAGRLVHYFYPVADRTWHSEVLATGCDPFGRLCLNPKWSGDGMAHLFVEAPHGSQIHRWWDGKAWGGDAQQVPMN